MCAITAMAGVAETSEVAASRSRGHAGSGRDDDSALRSELAKVRAQGFALVDQELELGLRTISVPLKSYRGEVLAAMNVSVHAARVTMDQLINDCLPALLQAQASLRTVL